jgi:hypothetical protein
MTSERDRQPRTHRALRPLVVRAALVALVLSAQARAQVTVVGPGEVPPPAPAPAPTPAPTTGGTDYDCLPACRDGFVCVMKQCVSACNPGCAEGEVCTGAARCVSACNPPCATGERCTSQGRCLGPTPPAASATPAPAAQPDDGPRYNFIPGAAPQGDLERREDEVAERRRTGKRFHDGFYLRLGLGVGYLLSKWTPSGDSESSGGALGFTVPTELAIGGAPVPGFVLGAGWWSINVPVASYTSGRGDFEKEEDGSYGSISMLGPFADIYPAPRSGFHLQVAPCLALVTPGSSDTIVSDSLSGSGLGVMAGLGYEGWIADQWGLGVLLRGQFAYVEISDDSDNTYDFLGVMPGLLMTATFN